MPPTNGDVTVSEMAVEIVRFEIDPDTETEMRQMRYVRSVGTVQG